MNKHLWVLNPLLLSLTLPAIAAEEENLIVSANRSQRTVAEMAQTTWVIEGSEIEQQVQADIAHGARLQPEHGGEQHGQRQGRNEQSDGVARKPHAAAPSKDAARMFFSLTASPARSATISPSRKT